ncbi:MAG TPA: hypothetical protein VFX18_04035 [Candidatus Nitrosocosmicus sp.]|nr:hypothetical protein [Candidatus Nitrosocosmicus sp.]
MIETEGLVLQISRLELNAETSKSLLTEESMLKMFDSVDKMSKIKGDQ